MVQTTMATLSCYALSLIENHAKKKVRVNRYNYGAVKYHFIDLVENVR